MSTSLVFSILSAIYSFNQFEVQHQFLVLLSPNCYIGPSIKYVRKTFRKTNISNPQIRTRPCAYQKVRNVGFSENFA